MEFTIVYYDGNGIKSAVVEADGPFGNSPDWCEFLGEDPTQFSLNAVIMGKVEIYTENLD